MDRGAFLAAVHAVAESDTTKHLIFSLSFMLTGMELKAHVGQVRSIWGPTAQLSWLQNVHKREDGE